MLVLATVWTEESKRCCSSCCCCCCSRELVFARLLLLLLLPVLLLPRWLMPPLQGKDTCTDRRQPVFACSALSVFRCTYTAYLPKRLQEPLLLLRLLLLLGA